MFWVIYFSQLSVHSPHTLTPANREYSALSQLSPGGTVEYHRYLSQDGRCPG